MGGGALYPPFPITCRFWLLLQLGINQCCIFFKTPPSNFKKKRLQPQKIEISGCCTTVFCIFSLLGGPSPLVSRQVGFCANISKKSGYNHKRSKFQGVAPQYSVFFHYWGGPTPLISRQVGFFCQEGPRFYHDINAEKNRPPSYNNSA